MRTYNVISCQQITAHDNKDKVTTKYRISLQTKHKYKQIYINHNNKQYHRMNKTSRQISQQVQHNVEKWKTKPYKTTPNSGNNTHHTNRTKNNRISANMLNNSIQAAKYTNWHKLAIQRTTPLSIKNTK